MLFKHGKKPKTITKQKQNINETITKQNKTKLEEMPSTRWYMNLSQQNEYQCKQKLY